MSIVKTYNQQVDAYGGSDVVQSLTQASTGTTVNRHGTTLITTSGAGTVGNHGFTMQSPVAGVHKTLIVNLGSTRTVTIEAGADFVGESTGNTTITLTTAADYAVLSLVGISTSQWAVLYQNSTEISIA